MTEKRGKSGKLAAEELCLQVLGTLTFRSHDRHDEKGIENAAYGSESYSLAISKRCIDVLIKSRIRDDQRVSCPTSGVIVAFRVQYAQATALHSHTATYIPATRARGSILDGEDLKRF